MSDAGESRTKSTRVVRETGAGRGRESAAAKALEQNQGLPEPDGTMHKGSVFRSILAPLKPGRLLDLGAEKPGFPVTAAHLGWQVTSVGARMTDAPEADEESDPEIASLESAITWLDEDIREFSFAKGEFDLIAIHGLLHHLALDEQVALLRRCAGTPLLIDAKVANAIIDREGRYEGTLIREHSDSMDAIGRVPAIAPGDAASAAFMLTEDSLIRLARDSGYPIVLATRPPHRRDFTFYLCLPKNWNPPGTGGKGRSRRLARRDGFERSPGQQEAAAAL